MKRIHKFPFRYKANKSSKLKRNIIITDITDKVIKELQQINKKP
jgi:hypothetical protein